MQYICSLWAHANRKHGMHQRIQDVSSRVAAMVVVHMSLHIYIYIYSHRYVEAAPVPVTLSLRANGERILQSSQLQPLLEDVSRETADTSHARPAKVGAQKTA